MKRALCIALAAVLMLQARALADVERSPLLDAAFSLLEKDNVFQRRYNERTGACVTSLFDTGMPYFFGGKPGRLLMSRYPEFARRRCWEDTDHFEAGQSYVYGLDCTGFIMWVRRQAGLPELPDISDILLYRKYRENALYNGGRSMGKDADTLPGPQELTKSLRAGDLLITRGRYRHVMIYIGTLRDYGFTAESDPETAKVLDHPLVIHSGDHPRYAQAISDYILAHQDYFDNCRTTSGGVSVALLYAPPAEAPHHKTSQGAAFDYYLIDQGRYELIIRPTDNLRRYCWYRPD